MNRICCVLLVLSIGAENAAAQSGVIPFQGYLTDEAGSPLPDGNYSMTFRLYGVATGGNALWSEAKLVSVNGGLFATGLGSITALTVLSFDSPYWLGIQVGTQEELQPRIALGAAPYSLRAAAVDDGAIISSKIADQAVSTVKLEDASVTTAKLTNLAVTTVKLAESAVTTAKLANQSVTGAKISTAGASAGQTLVYDGSSVAWRMPDSGVSLPYSGFVDRQGGSAFTVVNTTTNGPARGIMGVLRSATGSGLYGWAEPSSGTTYGVIGRSQSSSGTGVYGFSDASTGTTYGIRGMAQSSAGYAGYFEGRGYFSGFLGVGTSSPTARLHLESPGIEGDVTINMKVGGSWTAQIQQTASSNFSISNGGQIRMSIQPNGSVGIGTTSPAARLDVDGDARISGELRHTRNGDANMMPIAYGMVSGNGTLNANSGNVTVSRTGSGRYTISIEGESVLFTNYVILATPTSSVSVRAGSLGGNVRISTDGSSGAADADFYFVVYKP